MRVDKQRGPGNSWPLSWMLYPSVLCRQLRWIVNISLYLETVRKSERGLIYLETDEDLALMKLTRVKKHLAWVGKGKGWKSAVNSEAGVQPGTSETIKA